MAKFDCITAFYSDKTQRQSVCIRIELPPLPVIQKFGSILFKKYSAMKIAGPCANGDIGNFGAVYFYIYLIHIVFQRFIPAWLHTVSLP